ncbi:hypothetical protein LJ656_19050 [Paraburkholderia sp. MMS20-SJTR3]|uniref:GGDEF domain-containing protein, diguanylate cyclase (C-di-GMP synthetase) or its enzymatically inactive variants n=1 Tax=Paraburkholderia sejongensis TaxID=2886946 RepID=A0ABS8JXS9_9BURK|nr:hypothetical protein [Paraburkholderia sp. MMS20-SJTR3]MCC8394694.1 hypothetical protein [Paraburkholderia sp. MMS20-SJTR3]
MTFDVATFTSLWLVTFLCCALLTTALSRTFAQVVAFRFWAVAFFLNAGSAACVFAHLTWHSNVLSVLAATLALQCRLLLWAGLRKLLGSRAPWRTGLALSLLFCALYAGMLAFHVPILWRAALLALFFLPYRIGTLYEVWRPRRGKLGPARSIATIGGVIACFNSTLPFLLALANRSHLSLLLGSPQTMSALYAFVFAGDLLLASGLLVLAFKLLSVERNMLATLDRSASAQLAASRTLRALQRRRDRLAHVYGQHDGITHPQPLSWNV